MTRDEGKAFYQEQLMLMGSGQIDALVEQHYHEDAIMVTFDGIRSGYAELKRYFVDTLALMGTITHLSTEYFEATDDVIIFKATIISEGRGKVFADNALYLKDGKIWRHIALTLLPDVDYAELGTLWTDD